MTLSGLKEARMIPCKGLCPQNSCIKNQSSAGHLVPHMHLRGVPSIYSGAKSIHAHKYGYVQMCLCVLMHELGL